MKSKKIEKGNSMNRELRIIVTQMCNYACTFCHKEGIKRQTESKLTSLDYKFLFETCKENYNWNKVSITGGEPFMSTDIDDIIKEISDANGEITVVTNGELLEKHLDIIPYIKRINLSLHTLNEEVYTNIINRKNKMTKILNNIALIRNFYPNVEIRLNTVIVKDVNDNENDILEFIEFSEKIGASIKFIELYTENKDEIIKIEYIENILINNKFKYNEGSNIVKKSMSRGKTNVILSRIFCANAKKHNNPSNYCSKNNDFFITPDGYINTCREKNSEISIINEIKERNIKGLVKKMDEAINSIGKNCIFNEEQKLAINGGVMIFKDKNEGRYIHPKITKEIENAVIEQLHDTISIYDNSNIFHKFEKAFSEYHNKKYGIVISSGTAALWSMYDAIGLKKGDEIICPNYTFFATNSPIFFVGATPVLVDCNDRGNINVEEIEKKITNKTKAIVVTHMWGYPCEMDKLRQIADNHNIYLLEDCSHAHGGSYKGKKLGEWGDVAAFSLQGNKIITGGEGGILITNIKDIYQKAILLGHYNKRCKKEIDKDSSIYKYSVTGKGMKLRAHPLAIRIAYEQFKQIDEMNKQKNEFANLFIEHLKDIKGLEILKPEEGSNNSWYAMIIKYDQKLMNNVSRERFVQALNEEGAVEVDIPNSTCPSSHLELFSSTEELFSEYVQGIKYDESEFENSNLFYNNIIKIPMWEHKEDEEIVYKYIRAIKKVVNNIKEL